MAEERGFNRTAGAGTNPAELEDIVEDFDEYEYEDDNPVVRFFKNFGNGFMNLWKANTLNKILMGGGGVLALAIIFVLVAVLSGSTGDNLADGESSGKELTAVKPVEADLTDIEKPKPKVEIPDKDAKVAVKPVDDVELDENGKPIFKMYSESDAMDVTDELLDTIVRPTSEILAEEEAARVAATPVVASSGGTSSGTRSTGGYSASPVNHTGSYSSGQVGTLQISSIGLNAKVNSTPTLLDYGSSPNIPGLGNGVGHYPNTPWLDGTVGLAAHNNTYFKNLHKAQIGDEVVYTVNGVTRTYKIVGSQYVNDDAWGVFVADGSNKLVMTTCERNEFHGRLAVTAVQVGGDTINGVEQPMYATAPSTSSDNTASVPSGGIGYTQGASKPASGDTRGQNGHQNDIVEGNIPVVQDADYLDTGHNDWVDMFTGSY